MEPLTFLDAIQLGSYLTLGYLITDRLLWPLATQLWNMVLGAIKLK